MLPALAAKRAVNVAAARSAVRAFSVQAAARKDFVQEAYLRELKAYKPPQKAADAHVGQVRDFHAPSPPKAPETPSSSSLSSELEAYASSEPDLAEASSKAASTEGLTESHHEDVSAYLAEAAKPVAKEAHH